MNYFRAWKFYRSQGASVLVTIQNIYHAGLIEKRIARKLKEFLKFRELIGSPIKANDFGKRMIERQLENILRDIVVDLGVSEGMVKINNVTINEDTGVTVLDISGPKTVIDKIKEIQE